MSSGGKRLRWALLLAGLVALVYAPLQSAMPVGDDPRALAAIARVDLALGGAGTAEGAVDGGAEALPPRRAPRGERGLRALHALEAEGVGPLGAASLVLSSRLWRGSGPWGEGSLYMLRAENLALLLAAALALGLFVRRLLQPWSSVEHAYAAGIAATFLFALHPLSPSAVSSPASRGDLMAAALIFGAGALFLRGRQRRRPRQVLLAAALVLVAGLASELALLVAPLLFVAEHASARRGRTPAARRRTALTTFLAFGVASASGVVLRASLGLDAWPARIRAGLGMFDDFGDAFRAVALGFERFGLLLFPVNAAGTGLFDFVALGLLLLLVLHPALAAARAAPRFWSAVLLVWFLGMLAAQIPAANLRVHPNDWTQARQLLPGAAVMAVGLAVAATAVSGRRRVVIPVIIVLGLGLLARVDADCLNRAGRPARRLQVDLLEALERFGPERHVLVVAPPGLVRAHLSVAPELSWLVDPSLVGERAPSPHARVRGLSVDAFRELMRQPEARAMRDEGGLVVHVPFRELGLVPREGERERLAVLVPSPATREVPPGPPGEPRSWEGEGASPELALDPREVGSLTAIPPADRPPLLPPLARWRSDGEPRLPAGLQGTWMVGEEGPYAVFDLDRSLGWLLAGTVERIWLEGGVAEPRVARLAPDLPPLAVPAAPLVRGDAWVFVLDADAPQPYEADQRFVLSLLDLETLRLFELPAYLTARGELVADDVEPLLRRMRRFGGPLSWSLEHRTGERAIARASGRL